MAKPWEEPPLIPVDEILGALFGVISTLVVFRLLGLRFGHRDAWSPELRERMFR